MAAPSSTSSSERRRLPWGGLLAVIMVIVLDATLFERFAPWAWMHNRIDKSSHMELGVSSDRLSFEAARAPRDESLRVATLGSSRAARGLVNFELAQDALQDVEFLRFCHAGMSPFELYALGSELAETPPDVAIILLSEFDTHRPIRLQTSLGAGSLSATWNLSRVAGADFSFEHRDTFLGLSLAGVLNAYRFRAIWAAAELSTWRRFIPRLEDRKRNLLNAPFVMKGEQPLPLNLSETVSANEAAFPEVNPRTLRAQLLQLRGVTRGPHSELQMQLVRLLVARLREAGSQVLIVEGPVFPGARAYSRSEATDEFRALAKELESRPGVEVLWLSESGPFSTEMFGDLSHLNEQGSGQLASSVRARLLPMLKLAP